ncbi:MAG: hypothetical protein O2900_12005, partial [Proteobacteria bacterium]|nr:hypothetical protein [Pseudomonadota bacterium]
QAIALMGNHEFNAICYHTLSSSGNDYLRPHIDKNTNQHESFLREYQTDSVELEETISWFRSLPIWWEDPDVRAIHACWYEPAREFLLDHGLTDPQGQIITDDCEVFVEEHDSDDQMNPFRALEILIKGPEMVLGKEAYTDNQGYKRKHGRLKWWNQKTLGNWLPWARMVLKVHSQRPNSTNNNSIFILPTSRFSLDTTRNLRWCCNLNSVAWISGQDMVGHCLPIAGQEKNL